MVKKPKAKNNPWGVLLFKPMPKLPRFHSGPPPEPPIQMFAEYDDVTPAAMASLAGSMTGHEIYRVDPSPKHPGCSWRVVVHYRTCDVLAYAFVDDFGYLIAKRGL